MLERILEYHDRFGLNNRDAMKENIATLRSIGYSDREIRAMYSILKRKSVDHIDDLIR